MKEIMPHPCSPSTTEGQQVRCQIAPDIQDADNRDKWMLYSREYDTNSCIYLPTSNKEREREWNYFVCIIGIQKSTSCAETIPISILFVNAFCVHVNITEFYTLDIDKDPAVIEQELMVSE